MTKRKETKEVNTLKATMDGQAEQLKSQIPNKSTEALDVAIQEAFDEDGTTGFIFTELADTMSSINVLIVECTSRLDAVLTRIGIPTLSVDDDATPRTSSMGSIGALEERFSDSDIILDKMEKMAAALGFLFNSDNNTTLCQGASPATEASRIESLIQRTNSIFGRTQNIVDALTSNANALSLGKPSMCPIAYTTIFPSGSPIGNLLTSEKEEAPTDSSCSPQDSNYSVTTIGYGMERLHTLVVTELTYVLSYIEKL